MNDYIDYLKESTDTVKSKVSLSKLILIISYLIIWVFSVIAFWFFTDGADAMAYGLIFLWGLLPVTTFVISLLIATNNFWKGKKWLSALILGTQFFVCSKTFSFIRYCTAFFYKCIYFRIIDKCTVTRGSHLAGMLE